MRKLGETEDLGLMDVLSRDFEALGLSKGEEVIVEERKNGEEKSVRESVEEILPRRGSSRKERMERNAVVKREDKFEIVKRAEHLKEQTYSPKKP